MHSSPGGESRMRRKFSRALSLDGEQQGILSLKTQPTKEERRAAAAALPVQSLEDKMAKVKKSDKIMHRVYSFFDAVDVSRAEATCPAWLEIARGTSSTGSVWRWLYMLQPQRSLPEGCHPFYGDVGAKDRRACGNQGGAPQLKAIRALESLYSELEWPDDAPENDEASDGSFWQKKYIAVSVCCLCRSARSVEHAPATTPTRCWCSGLPQASSTSWLSHRVATCSKPLQRHEASVDVLSDYQAEQAAAAKGKRRSIVRSAPSGWSTQLELAKKLTNGDADQ